MFFMDTDFDIFKLYQHVYKKSTEKNIVKYRIGL